MITQVTTFPVTPAIPGGNQFTVTGTTGTELKNGLVSQLQARKDQATSGATAAQAAIDQING